jgi:hypothetical protein
MGRADDARALSRSFHTRDDPLELSGAMWVRELSVSG